MNTYWENNGKHQDWVEVLQKQVPAQGEAEELHIDLLRNVANCYYDHYNNGNCNWDHKQEQFAHIEYHADKLEAAAEIEGITSTWRLLKDIRRPLDEDLDDGLGYLGQDSETLEDNLEKLVDIVVRWAWGIEQAQAVQ